ncbi:MULTISPECIES: hydantoinase/oxoprolinase family protein [unclassified Methanoregula]|uniref:hydantoinase/oxoprolinase family protein n=1 Tax=unclassified Methanoregula TaxID=2649730 RepID=UPI0009D5AF3F|nr:MULTISPECIES: hydantoinase/oxoprolinase family protein [unclassified Methanoregula]OPX63911.1 MAG: Hydantoinase/oxoprolinase [Methanoregula sp. PtaB.Bin085]OPY35463.1 MAG: Hydantoinase/oxoprolinase [Methanoregula sp. PtaU1.Bin006]
MIGIDVGGANLKVVDDTGVHIHYCPLWEGAPIPELLVSYAAGTGDPAFVVMSGELADCFENKLQGISFIVDAVRKAIPRARFYGTDACFHNHAVPQLAAANWLASADYLRTRYPDALLLDIGSTTADIIPLGRFDRLLGLTDTQRLQAGYLVYTGMLRTNVATLIQTVDLAGVPTPVSSEYFATSADAHLVLGHITPSLYTCDTPDRKEKTNEAAFRRLARVVCADLDEIGISGAMQVAEQFWKVQRDIVCGTARRVSQISGAREIIVAGIGAPLFCAELGGIDLTRELGPAADALPAFAVRELGKANDL